MPKWIAGKQKEREKEGETERGYYVENEIESRPDSPHLGPCAQHVTWQLKLKSSMDERGKLASGKWEIAYGLRLLLVHRFAIVSRTSIL